jgi:hypothetical protein
VTALPESSAGESVALTEAEAAGLAESRVEGENAVVAEAIGLREGDTENKRLPVPPPSEAESSADCVAAAVAVGAGAVAVP